jgi:hypothetical protein
MIPKKWRPVFRQDHAPTKGHDPEKWEPVFGQDHAPTKDQGRVVIHVNGIAL